MNRYRESAASSSSSSSSSSTSYGELSTDTPEEGDYDNDERAPDSPTVDNPHRIIVRVVAPPVINVIPGPDDDDDDGDDEGGGETSRRRRKRRRRRSESSVLTMKKRMYLYQPCTDDLSDQSLMRRCREAMKTDNGRSKKLIADRVAWWMEVGNQVLANAPSDEDISADMLSWLLGSIALPLITDTLVRVTQSLALVYGQVASASASFARDDGTATTRTLERKMWSHAETQCVLVTIESRIRPDDMSEFMHRSGSAIRAQFKQVRHLWNTTFVGDVALLACGLLLCNEWRATSDELDGILRAVFAAQSNSVNTRQTLVANKLVFVASRRSAKRDGGNRTYRLGSTFTAALSESIIESATCIRDTPGIAASNYAEFYQRMRIELNDARERVLTLSSSDS